MSHTILGVRIDDLSLGEVRSRISDWLEHARGKIIVTPNAEMLVLSRRDEVLRRNLNGADLAVADTVSIRYAVAALTEERLQHRIPGVDLVQEIAGLCRENEQTLLLLGGDPGAAEQAAEVLGAEGLDPGQISFDGETVRISRTLIETLRQINPDAVAVGLGQGKQEAFMTTAREVLPDVRVWIGVGGSFDMISGQKKRAPQGLRSMGLEWVWRLIIEPSRWRRIARASVVFPLSVAWITLKRGTIIAATGRVFKEVYRQFRTV